MSALIVRKIKLNVAVAIKSVAYSSSTMSCKRSIWKGPYIHSSLTNLHGESFKNAKITSRASTVPMSMIGQVVHIHNGKEFKRIPITREKVGYKFGEFVQTRKNVPKAAAAKPKTPIAAKKKK